MDQDDREILIESALGGNHHYSNNEQQRHLKSRRSHGRKTKGQSGGSLTSPNKRSYSPFRGRDIFTEEEMMSLTHQAPDSIFENPTIVKKHKRTILRVLAVLIGMLIYFIIITTSSQFKKTKRSNDMMGNKSVETDVDIKTITSNNVFKDATGRSKVTNRGKAINMGHANAEDDDMGLSNAGADDMVSEKALQNVKVNKINKAIEQKHVVADKAVGQEAIEKVGISPEEIFDDYVGGDETKNKLLEDNINDNLNDNTASHDAYLAQIESSSKPQIDHGSTNEKAVTVDTSKISKSNLKGVVQTKSVYPSQYNLTTTNSTSNSTP